MYTQNNKSKCSHLFPLSWPAILVALLTLTFAYNVASAPQVRVAISPLSNKIQQPTITAVLRDREGLLWIGTQHGIYRFDGANRTKFGSDQTGKNWIPASYIKRIVETKDGRIFVATFGGGLLKWNSAVNTFEKPHRAKTSDELYISELALAADGVIWIGGRDGLSFYNSSSTDENPTPFVGFAGIKDQEELSAITADDDGNIYVAFGLKLYRISKDRKDFELLYWKKTNEKNLPDRITALAFDKSNTIYIGTDAGQLTSVDLSKDHVQPEIKLRSKSAISIIDMIFHNDLLWIATNNGLYYTNRSLSEIESLYESNSGLSNSHVTSLVADNGLMWVGTYQGLNSLSLVPFELFSQQNSGIFNDVLAFSEDESQKVWIGTFDGLYVYDERLGSHASFNEISGSGELIDHRVMAISSRKNELWLGFRRNGLQIVNTDSLEIFTPPDPILQQLEVTKILHSFGTETWIASFNRGLYKLKDNRVVSYLSNGKLPETSITILYKTASGEIIASSEHNIYQYDETKDQFNRLKLNFGGLAKVPLILSISQSPDGDIWIGTKDQGLFIWRKSNQISGQLDLENITKHSDFILSTLYAIQFDDDDYGWGSTQSGIVKFDSKGTILARFVVSDGLQGLDFNFGASLTDSAGNIYFGGSNGYNRFDPKSINTIRVPPKILLNKIAISRGGKIELFERRDITQIQLTHKDYFIQFDFSVLDFLDPEKNQYRYMLEGFDHDWIENGTRNSATYTSLPPGDYRLRVQGANSAGVWNREGLSLGIEVLPPPWLSWWAYTIYALVLTFLGWLGMRAYNSYVVGRLARTLAAEMVETQQRADDEMQEQLEIHDDLVKSVYQHSVSTLNLVSEFIAIKGSHLGDEISRELTLANVNRVESLALLEQCLYYQNEVLLADLNKYTNIISSRLLKQAPGGQESISTINQVAAQPLPIDQASPLAIAIYELLENAIQHAFEGTVGANYIQISFGPASANNADYQLTIQDNGVGIPPNIDPMSAQTPGLAVVAAMNERLGGELTITTGTGTIVSITFPGAHT